MQVVRTHSQGGWPDVEVWLRYLPAWFAGRFRIAGSPDAELAWLERWRGAPQNVQMHMEASRGWTLDEWLAVMKPELRQWRWWRASTNIKSRLEVMVQDVPFLWGCLRQLALNCGALEIKEA